MALLWRRFQLFNVMTRACVHLFLCLSPPLDCEPLEGRAWISFMPGALSPGIRLAQESNIAFQIVGTVRIPKRTGIGHESFGRTWSGSPWCRSCMRPEGGLDQPSVSQMREGGPAQGLSCPQLEEQIAGRAWITDPLIPKLVLESLGGASLTCWYHTFEFAKQVCAPRPESGQAALHLCLPSEQPVFVGRIWALDAPLFLAMSPNFCT